MRSSEFCKVPLKASNNDKESTNDSYFLHVFTIMLILRVSLLIIIRYCTLLIAL